MRKKLPPEIGTVYLEGSPSILDYETAVVLAVLDWDGEGGTATPRGELGPVASFAHGKQRFIVRDETGEELEWEIWDEELDAHEGDVLSAVYAVDTGEVWMFYNHDNDTFAVHPEPIGKRRLVAATIIPALISAFVFFLTVFIVATSNFSWGIKAAIAAFGCVVGVTYIVGYPFNNMRMRNREIERYETEYAPRIADYLRTYRRSMNAVEREVGVP